MSADLIERLLADDDPAFECKAIHGAPESERHLEALVHLANPPAHDGLLSRIPDIPGKDAVVAFYRRHNGVLLYTDRATETAGLEIFAVERWHERTAQTIESWAFDEELYRDDQMPYGRNDFIAFALSRGASNCLHWVVRGPRAGTVCGWAWTKPPRRVTPPMAASFAEFLGLVYERPVYFFNDLCGRNTRFTNHRPLVEWLPDRYLPSRHQPGVGR